MEQLKNYDSRLQFSMNSRLALQKQRMEHYRTRLGYLSPEKLLRDRRMYLLQTEEKLQQRMEQILKEYRHRLGIYIERVKGLSPLEKLNQGFAYVEGVQGRSVTSAEQVQAGELLQIHVRDGKIYSRVEKIEKEGACVWEQKK